MMGYNCDIEQLKSLVAHTGEKGPTRPIFEALLTYIEALEDRVRYLEITADHHQSED